MVRLIAITDAGAGGFEAVLAQMTRLLVSAAPGTVMVQLRFPGAPLAEVLRAGRVLRAMTRAHGQLLAVNDRIDLALLLDADALHLGERSVRTEDARRLWGARTVTRAVHSVTATVEADADMVLLSPIIAPRKGAPALGVGALSAARRMLEAKPGRRLFALGGVDGTTAAACLAAGADGVAAIGAVQADPRGLLASLGALPRGIGGAPEP